MGASETVEQIVAGGIVAIIRLPFAEDLLPVAEAIHEGGVAAIELTLAVPGALDALERARLQLGRGIRLGVGTVLAVKQARDALQAGAEFLVAPAFNPEVIRTAREADVAVVSGAFTPTEIVQAHEAGASLVMVFPAGSVGPRYIQDMLGPLPHIALMPRGGVSLENAGAFIQAGAAALGVGDDLATRDLLERRDFRGIAARAREFTEAIARARVRAGRPTPPVRPVEGPDIR